MIELLDFNKQWAKIKAGWNEGKMWKSPARSPNPKGFATGYAETAYEAQRVMDNGQRIGSAFTGKTFNQRK